MDILSWKTSLRKRSMTFLKMLRRGDRCFDFCDQPVHALFANERAVDELEGKLILRDETGDIFENTYRSCCLYENKCKSLGIE